MSCSGQGVLIKTLTRQNIPRAHVSQLVRICNLLIQNQVVYLQIQNREYDEYDDDDD